MIKRVVQVIFIIALLVIANVVPSFSSEKNTVLEETLDCRYGDISGEGWAYSRANKTLTIEDLTINTEEQFGILVQDGTTIILNGDLDITVSHSYGTAISARGSFSIEGTGNLTIHEASSGLYSEGLTIELDGDLAINSKEPIRTTVKGETFIKANSLEIKDSAYGILAYRNLFLELENLHIEASQCGIFVSGDANICIDGQAIIETESDSSIEVTGVLSIEGQGIVTVDNVIRASGIVVRDTISVNGLVTLSSNDSSIVYGTFTPRDESSYHGNSLSFMEGSLLVIEAGRKVSLSGFSTVDTTNMSIINNGILKVSQVDSFKTIEGLGYLLVYSLEIYENIYYDNEGTLLEDITLEDKEVSNDLYSWLKNSDDIYTLEVHKEIVGNIFIQTKEAIIDLQQDTSVLGLYFVIGQENSNLLICGNYTLNSMQGIYIEPVLSTFVVSSDSMINTKEISAYIEYKEFEMTDISCKVEVFGKVVTDALFIHELVVHNKASFEVTTSFCLLVGSTSNKSSLTIGEQLEVISPTSAEIRTVEEGDLYYIYLAPEGFVPDDHGLRDAGFSILIGSKPTYTISVSTTDGGLVEGDSIAYEGLDQEFIFTPDKGYEITSVIVDGKDLGAMDSYTFESVTSNHTLEVIFTKTLEDNTDNDVNIDGNVDTDNDVNTEGNVDTDSDVESDTNVDVDKEENDNTNNDETENDTPSSNGHLQEGTVDTSDAVNVVLYVGFIIMSIAFIYIANKKK